MAFAGPKGGITLSLMLSIPTYLSSGATFPERTTLVTMAAGIILGSLLLANFAVPLLVPRKASARRAAERADAEISLVIRVIESIQADAHLTGAVRADEPAKAPTGAPAAVPGTSAAGSVPDEGSAPSAVAEEVDEPATVIVMQRYAEVLEELAPHASAEAAARARATAAAVEALYGRIDDIAREVGELDSLEEDGPDGAADPRSGLTARFRALRAVYDAVEDVQAQALARELEYLKELRLAGAIAPDHARELRNDIYIQQLTLE